MKIETKLNINDKVWIMHDNKPCEFSIDCIEVSCHFVDSPVIGYSCFLLGEPHIKVVFREHQLGKIAFFNKKELVNSLL